MMRFAFKLDSTDSSGAGNAVSLFFDATYSATGEDWSLYRSAVAYPSSYDIGCSATATAMSYVAGLGSADIVVAGTVG
jgi:hypothetical protein